MTDKWKPGTVYFCGEFHAEKGIIEPILVMLVETEMRGLWAEGKIIILNHNSFVLTNRELDRKTQMVTYKLKKLAEPSPLEL